MAHRRSRERPLLQRSACQSDKRFLAAPSSLGLGYECGPISRARPAPLRQRACNDLRALTHVPDPIQTSWRLYARAPVCNGGRSRRACRCGWRGVWAGRAAATVDAEVQPARAPGPSGRVEQVTDATFDREVLRAKRPCAVLFYDARNQDSQRFKRVYEKVARQYGDEVKFTALDVEQNRPTAKTYKVATTPTTIVFDNRQVAATIRGAVSEDELVAAIADAL